MADDTGTLQDQFSNALDSMFATGADFASSIRNLTAAARPALQAEVLRLEKRYGANDRRTVAAKAALADNQTALRSLEVNADLAAAKVETAGEDEMMIEGRVTDSLKRGIPGLVVALTNEKGRRVAKVTPSSTGVGGYFAIHLTKDSLPKVSDACTGGVFVSVFTAKNVVLKRLADPLVLKIPGHLFLEIDIDAANPAPTTRDQKGTPGTGEKTPGKKAKGRTSPSTGGKATGSRGKTKSSHKGRPQDPEEPAKK